MYWSADCVHVRTFLCSSSFVFAKKEAPWKHHSFVTWSNGNKYSNHLAERRTTRDAESAVDKGATCTPQFKNHCVISRALKILRFKLVFFLIASVAPPCLGCIVLTRPLRSSPVSTLSQWCSFLIILSGVISHVVDTFINIGTKSPLKYANKYNKHYN